MINRERREHIRLHRIECQLIALDAAWPKIDAYATALLESGEIRSIADLMAHRPLNQLLAEFHGRLDRLRKKLQDGAE